VPLLSNAEIQDENQTHDEQAAHDHAQNDAPEAGHEHAAGHEEADAPVDAMGYYLDPAHLFGHVQDSTHFEVPKLISSAGVINIPNPLGFTRETPMVGHKDSPYKFVGAPTKFMVLELFAAILIAVAFIWLARKVKTGGAPKGKLWNMLEAVVLFVRDDMARPAIGEADADRYMPFLLTLFFFILVLNLLGMIPFLGSPTASLAVTAVFALITFGVVLGSGFKKMGVVGFFKAQAPHMDMGGIGGMVLTGAIWCIEMFGLFVKHFVLAIRLFANMFAGHLVLAVFVAFIGVTAASFLVYAVAPSVIVASVALSLLELFVAFLQAYVFVFLAALFIGMALHPH
jgi:F-type H+-transporting ATPase subunit a